MPLNSSPCRLLLLTLLRSSMGPASAQTTIPALDQDGRKGDMARLAKDQAVAKFNAADGDKDGKLSREEVEKAFPYMAENFTKLDKDGDAGKDDVAAAEKRLDGLTKKHTDLIDDLLKHKESELLEV